MHAENNLSPEDRQGIENAVLAKKDIIPDWIANFNRQDIEDIQDKTQYLRDTVDRLKNTVNSYSKQYPTLEPIARKIRIITKPTENTLKIMDYSLEYVLNGERSVVIKAIAEGVETIVYTVGISATAIAAGIVSLVGILCPDSAPLVAFGAFVIFTKGEELSYYISQKAKEIIINFLNPKIQYFPQTIHLGNGQYYKNDKNIDEIFNNIYEVLGFSLFTPRPYPSYSKQYKLALAKKKELITKTSIASTTYNFIDEEYLKNIQDLKEQEKIIEQEEQKYQLDLKLYKEDNKIKNEIFNSLFKSLNEKLSFQLKQEKNTFLNSNQSLSIIANKQYLLKTLNLQDINNINIDSKPYLLKALYFCEDYVLYDKDKQALFDENTIKELEFNSSFYTIFISHKNKLNDTYLNTRKELYKSIDEFKRLGFKDLEHAYQTYMSSFTINEELNNKDKTINKNENKEINKNLNQESDTKEDFKIVSYHLKNLSHFILENKDKNKKLIFFDNASSMSNLLHLYENNCDIFVKDESLIDIALLEQNYNLDFNKLKTRVFFYEKLLLGAKEDEIFSFNDEKINYYLKYDENNLYAFKDLNITYDYYHCKIKNYVLAKNSLNIKLEPKKISKHYAYDDLNHQDLNLTHNNTSIINNTATSNYISLIIQDEHGKAIDNASISIKGYDHEKLIKQSVLKLKTNKEGKIRFDREKDFSNCYSFKVRLEDNKAYLAKPLQDSKRIFNNYTNHKIGLILRFKNKDYFKYDGFYLYHFKGKDLIASYMARSGVAKADNLKPSNKQIAFSFYQDIKDKTTKKKAYFYYDDESIKDKFGSLPEGKYYFKINEIHYNKQPDFLKDYPFSIGKTWGKYCVRLYTDKECSKSFKEIEISNPNDEKEKSKNKESISKGDLYLYNINEKGEFGSNGSIGILNGVLFENLLKYLGYVVNEEELLCELEVQYPQKPNNKIVFASDNINPNTSFAPGTYISLQLEKESDEKLKWAFVECESKEKLNLLLHDCNGYVDEKNLKVLFENDDLIYNESYEDNVLSFCLPINRSNEPKEDMQDYKYYIVVFAYSSEKTIPNLEDHYIIIDMSFRVGVGDDDSVREGVLRESIKNANENNSTKDIIYTNCIFSVSKAIEFLIACNRLKKNNKIDNNIFFKTYPQLAGKIAYIYYRFDLANEKFIKSVKDGDEYLKEREKFYITASEIYNQNPIYRLTFEKNIQNEDVDIEIIKDFLKNFAKRLNINEKDLPIITNNPNKGNSGDYDFTTNILSLNTRAHYIDFIDTIIHEFRHFYICRININPNNSLERLLFLNTMELYIQWNHYNIFNAYSKKCLPFDSAEHGTHKCFINKTYYESRKKIVITKGKKKDLTASPLYFIQPSERDTKIIAGKFREKTGIIQ
ncbi:hypothetical protein CSUB8523_1145 [Campylobacter subantarcticus LMG 24377]|uniref:hypothetical protein n=2 Tax=Campylobacter subantarcticus TaxID=497724 RepID=UPI000581EEC2|nr:hypothetical protein [Campylobacter subantarcticus]AJC92653.1 hypothetical protein CSUB8523_1145 [Campylobacter subantarcticus LMG 24377]